MLIKETPVLILAFNRDKKFKTCLQNIYNCGFRYIFLSVDGPRNEKDAFLQANIKSVFEEFASFEKSKFESNFIKSNLGCRAGVISGINWFFKKVDYGLIIEDDVLLTSNVSNAFCELLEKYENDESIMSISSFNEFLIAEKNQITKCPIFRSWGWATWAKKWNEHINFSKIIEKKSIRQCLNLLPNNMQNIKNTRLVKACHLGLLDTWDYEYNFTHLALSKYSLTFTGQNCKNIGFDLDATHTKDPLLNNIDFSRFNNLPIDIENEIIMDDNSKKLLLKMAGFKQKKENIFDNKLINLLISYKVSFVFYLRKLKRRVLKKIYL